MSNSINTNIASYYAQANITEASNLASASVARLSSGNRIVEASDDVAGLATGTSLLSQVSVLKTAQNNATQGTSLLQVADGALAQIQSILQQQQALALQAESGSLTDTDRGFLNQQFQQLTAEINSLATGTSFNGVNLIDGSIATGGSNNPLSVDTTPTNQLATVKGFTATSGGSFTALGMINSTGTGTENDTAFIGDLSKGVFSVTSTGVANTYVVSYTINGQTYSGKIVTSATGGKLDLINTNATAATSSKGMIEFTVSAADVHTKSDADTAADLQAALTASVSGATAYAVHDTATVLAKDTNNNPIAGSAIQSTDTAGTLLAGFDGSKVLMQSQLFNGSKMPSISDFSATGTGTNVVFSVQVNGVTYSTAGAVTGTGTTISGTIFNGVETDLNGAGGGAETGLLTFYKNGDTTTTDAANYEQLQLNLSGVQANALITTAGDVQNVVAALNQAFGSGGGAGGGLSFQLGTTASSNVGITIANAQTSALFNGAALDISTQGGATTAAAAMTSALNSITASRAGVGAYESQFNFASAALQTSVQNESAAASNFLDTDIAAESTSYATDQVKLQAGISVLAQANQQLQALLKLIG